MIVTRQSKWKKRWQGLRENNPLTNSEGFVRYMYWYTHTHTHTLRILQPENEIWWKQQHRCEGLKSSHRQNRWHIWWANTSQMTTVYAEIFMGEIFRVLNFRGWSRPQKLAATKIFLPLDSLLDGKMAAEFRKKSYACVDTTFTTCGKLLLEKRQFV